MFKSSKRKRLFTVGAERGNKGPDVMSDGIFSSLFRDQRLTSSKERNINGEIIYIYIYHVTANAQTLWVNLHRNNKMMAVIILMRISLVRITNRDTA